MRSEERRKEKRMGEGLVEGKEQTKIKDGLIYSKKKFTSSFRQKMAQLLNIT